jgi:O-antigen/teichoic acid export membrane protein
MRSRETLQMTSGAVLARNTLLNIASKIIPLLVSVATVPFIIRGLGVDRFGILSLAWMVVVYIAILDFGLGPTVTKFVSAALGRGEQDKIPQIFSAAVLTQGIFGIIGTIILFFITPLLVERILNIPPHLRGEAAGMFYMLSLSFPVMLITNSVRGVLESHQRFDLINAVAIPASSATFLVPFFGALYGLSLPVIMALIVAVRAITMATYWGLGRRVYPDLVGLTWPPRSVIKSLFQFGIWVTVPRVLNTIMSQLDKLLIGMSLSVSAVTYYSAPCDMVRRIGIFSGSLGATVFPEFSALIGGNQLERLEHIFSRSVKYQCFLLGPLTCILIVLANDILGVWLGPAFAEQGTLVFQIIALATFINYLGSIPEFLLVASGRPDLISKLTFFMMPLNVLLMFGLTKMGGIAGTASALGFRLAIDGLALFFFSHQLYKFPAYLWRGSWKALLLLAGFTIAGCLVMQFLPMVILYRIALLVLLTIGMLSIFWLYIFDDIDRTQIYKFVTKFIGIRESAKN